MAERTARLGSMFYLDADGQYRRAYAGDKIQVHPDFVERFDRLNVLMGDAKSAEEPAEETPKEAEKPKPRRRTTKK